jgi:hypothetical protein
MAFLSTSASPSTFGNSSVKNNLKQRFGAVPFIPPIFSKFGRNATDAFKKKFAYDHEFTVLKKNEADGLNIEYGAVHASSGLRGLFKLTKNDPKIGKFEASISTDSSAPSTASFVFPMLTGTMKGTELTLDATTSDKTFQNNLPLVYGAKLLYSREALTGNVHFKTDLKTHILDYSVAVGAENVAFGYGGSVDVSNGADMRENNFGVEYTNGKYTLSAWTTKNVEVGNFAVCGKLPSGQNAALQLETSLRTPKPLATAVIEQALSADTTLKAKVQCPVNNSASLETALEHRLANPSVSFVLSSRINCSTLMSGSARADKFGFSVKVGDY